ncbi:hypothetical protein K2173_012532 [Erythroxylum novogranatense]|uniref:Uncharacterized protein n=1 Tax=Erythroxylum novogranatense TaxID=1862640 RepID=A0AAV8TJE9_9ROSI|nr:hypothetical protein K2173_012532 [Erythroxylum novogranatense]
MCIGVFLWQAHPLYSFLLFLNRDEFHSRPTKPLAWWGEDGQILGGKDEDAGGTWLACDRSGKIAFVTNFREVNKIPLARTRGDLPVRFLQSKKSPKEFAEDLVKDVNQYNGFNLVLVDICSRSMVYITNRPNSNCPLVKEVSPGMHVLANASLDSPWPKSERLGHSFKCQLDEHGEGELPLKEMVETLMTNTVKDEGNLLPHIYPVEREIPASSIFVDTDTPLGRYGTTSTSVLSVKLNGEVVFYQKYLVEEQWKETSVTFQVENMKRSGETVLIQAPLSE